ncbi:MAG TPA: 1,2-phenylacetyl-CoA epoxidase subunit PaaD [Saprospiraceae bacterium]|nr:1,2-phenylacetyl-CoA epoxidase subunit PaaD [Saprospiraceae bacterium]
MVTDTTKEEERIYDILRKVKDPEIPVLTIEDLGILRGVSIDNGELIVKITPTYNGCPAMDMIRRYVLLALEEEGYENARVELILSPAWTTDWISEEARQKLKDYGIAPPQGDSRDKRSLLGLDTKLECPHCGSEDTVLVSHFGSTACKAQYKCNECKEPFEYFKCH